MRFKPFSNHFDLSNSILVSNALSCTKYPFLAVIAYTPASTSHASAMTIHARLQGFLSPPALIANLNTVINRHGPVLSRIRAERSEQIQAREIRAQQDTAYEASLAADRERERLRVEQERLEQDRLAEIERAERERLSLEGQKKQYKQWRASQLKAVLPEYSQSAGSIARISIRLTSGDRVVTKFLAESQSVEDIYAFVDCYDLLQSENLAQVEKPAGYAHVYNFNLVSPMPRFIVPVDKQKLIKDEKSLFPNGSLIVEEIEEDDEEQE